jgi:hypothetical protein
MSYYGALNINPATKLVIPAAAERRAGILKRPCNCWNAAFADMTRSWISDGLSNWQVNSKLGAVNADHRVSRPSKYKGNSGKILLTTRRYQFEPM